MTLVFLATYAYISGIEKKSFAAGFNFSFRKIGKNIIWAFIFSLIALAVLAGYQFLIVRPLASKILEASVTGSEGMSKAFSERLIVYFYVVYEGIIEVLIFIGFLLDRLAIRWGWAGALAASNFCFALWHYAYWRNGLLEGTLMVVLTFIAGIIISLSYLKTKNSLSPTICHFLVDSPMAISELLGMMV
jgi:membrane protease YdiL (CAAX protease family)